MKLNETEQRWIDAIDEALEDDWDLPVCNMYLNCNKCIRTILMGDFYDPDKGIPTWQLKRWRRLIKQGALR